MGKLTVGSVVLVIFPSPNLKSLHMVSISIRTRNSQSHFYNSSLNL